MESRIETAERAAAEQAQRSFTVIPLRNDDLLKTLEDHGVTFRADVESHWLRDFIDNWILPIGVMVIIWVVIMRRMGQGPGVLNVGKSKAKIFEADPKTLVHFTDVAGVDEAAEEIVFGQISTGASDDIEKASRIARNMLTVYGMSRKLPNLSLVSGAAGGFLGQEPPPAPHSAEIEQLIGEEQLEILRQCYEEAKQFLGQKRTLLETLAQRLLKQEKIDAGDLLDILGPRPVGQGGSMIPLAASSSSQ